MTTDLIIPAVNIFFKLIRVSILKLNYNYIK